MATYQFHPPEPFTFSRTEEWPQWITRFERFRFASGLNTKAGEMQVSSLIYSMWHGADVFLRTFRLTAAEQSKYDTVRQKFDNFFVKKRNIIYEWARFI